VTIPTEACANHPIDPTGVQPATAAIQACLDAAPPGGTVALPVGTYAIDTMLQINHAVTLTTAGLTASSPGCDTTACAILQATSSFNAPPQGGWPAGIRSVLMVQSNDVTVDHIRIDGNRAARIQSWAAAQCRNGVTNAYGFSSMVFGARVSFRHVMVENTLCGTSIGWAGDDATLADSFVRDSGSHNDHNMWADGVTILQSDRMHVTNNHVMNGSDVSLILFGGRDGVTGNLIEQPGQGAFAGLMLFHEQSGTGGDFSNTLLQNNTLECHHNCSFGIHIGGRPWETGEATRVIGGLITGNTVHDSAYGVTVTNAGSTAAPVQVWGNTVTGPFRGSFGQLCPVGTTSGGVPFDLGPGNDIFGQPTDSFLDTHGEPPSHWSHYSMCRRD